MNSNEMFKKAEKIAYANLWEKNGMARIYVTYNGKKFYIDLVKMIATYGKGIKGNICNIRDFLEEAGIAFEPLTSTYNDEIKLIEEQ